MNEHCGFIVKVKELRPHTNADRLQVATFFGNDTCVGFDVKLNDKGIYFPSDLQLSEEFCDFNHMCRKKADGTEDSGYLERGKRNIKTIKLRGEYSDGIYCPLSALEFTGIDLNTLEVGTKIDVVNGYEICRKYIPRTNVKSSAQGGGSKKKGHVKEKEVLSFFAEHIDTPQLQYYPNLFKEGDIICLTEKVHGTSSRNANTLRLSHKSNIFTRLFHIKGREIKEYKYVVGTRRTTVKDEGNGGFYGTKKHWIDWGEKFKGKLYEGEEVFGEIAGFLDNGNPIMGTVSNKKVNDKDFARKYGESTTFSYGCDNAVEGRPQNRYFVYRMTYTSPEGFVIEYPWDMVRQRAEQMGFEVVPELDRFVYTTHEDMMERIEKWLDIPSTIDFRHVIEGVVVRALNAANDFRVAKIKSRNFKIIEGIMKDDANTPDMEEAEEVIEEI